MVQSVPSAKSRFTNWCNLGGPPLISMGRLIKEELLPSYLAADFKRVFVRLHDPTDAVSAREICLQRSCGNEIDVVTFNFDKYHRPSFQVHLHRRETRSPHSWVRAGNLVRTPSQYLHFWGKPWWSPTRLCSNAIPDRAMRQTCSGLYWG